MRNKLKATTIENKLPLLAVENGCIVSKDADLTVAFEVTLPELYTVTSQEYETIHGCWCKAIKVLPDYSIVHKQDWFIRETYKPELGNGMTFLSRSFERHFNERPYLKHSCYLYLTKTTKERNRMQSNFSTLCRGHIIPKELDKETASRFLESVEQFERIMNDSEFVKLRKLTDNEIVGTRRKAGVIERYLSLMPEDNASLQDIDLCPDEMKIGDNRLCLFTLSDVNDLPAKVHTDTRYERLSTDRSDCRLSFASPVGLLLPCNHIYNQYVLIDNSDDNLQQFEKTARNMQSLSKYSRSNAINKEESFYTFIEPAVCLFTEETNYRSSLSPFGIKMVDRLTGKPLHIDISDLPMKKGITTNRNKFVLGPSGSGKSFFMNHVVRQYYEQGTHVVLIDTGHSYSGLCDMIHRKTHGQDGIYYTYTEEHPISFNPFYTDDYVFDVEKKDSIVTLLLTLWKSENEEVTKTESGELGSAVSAYISMIQADHTVVPCFDTFYEYMRDVYRTQMAERDIKVGKDDFNIDNFLTTLRQYYRGGRYDFLLNSKENIDLLGKRFIVFEIDSIKDNKELFPVVTIIIMEAFINKMADLGKHGLLHALYVQDSA